MSSKMAERISAYKPCDIAQLAFVDKREKALRKQNAYYRSIREAHAKSSRANLDSHLHSNPSR